MKDQEPIRKRRLAIFLSDLNSSGGIQRVATSLALDLVPEYETTLLVAEPQEKSPVFFDSRVKYASLSVRRSWGGRLTQLGNLVRIGRALRRFVEVNRIDVIITIWYDMTIVAAISLPDQVIKIGSEHISFHHPSGKWQLLRRLFYRRLDAVVSLTQADLPKYARIARISCVIPNAVPLRENVKAADQREKLLLTVGHLIPRKGVDRLLWALKQPLRDNPEWKLVIIGGGERAHVDWGYCTYLQSLISLLGIQGRVELFPSTQDIDEWYERAAIYVMGSREEGLPLTLIEAKSHGMPVISFDCPTGPREVIRHGIDGYVIEDSTSKFSEAVQRVMKDDELRASLARESRIDAEERFAAPTIRKEWLGLIDRAAARIARKSV